MRQPVIAAGLLSGARAAADDRDSASERARQGSNALGLRVRWRRGRRVRTAGVTARRRRR